MDDETPMVDVPIKPLRRFQRTRLGVSMFFGVLTPCLCVLWVASVWLFVFVAVQLPTLSSGNNHLLQITGLGVINVYLLNVDPLTHPSGISYRPVGAVSSGQKLLLWFRFVADPNGEYTLAFPIWLPLLTSVAAGFVSWPSDSKFTFSVRSMLISTTLVAIVLGLGVWLTS